MFTGVRKETKIEQKLKYKKRDERFNIPSVIDISAERQFSLFLLYFFFSFLQLRYCLEGERNPIDLKLNSRNLTSAKSEGVREFSAKTRIEGSASRRRC